MQKIKIDWCDMTWNPVTGCLHGCPYCYARKIALRFGGDYLYKERIESPSQLFELDRCFLSQMNTENFPRINPYPYGFNPTFHRYRLDEPAQVKKPQNIFVCSMADLFGDWVPDEWIESVFDACQKAPQHRYLFLTKNPKRYLKLYEEKKFPYADNFWFGTSCTKLSDEYTFVKNTPYKCFVSIEPLLEPFGEIAVGELPDWVIVGSMTGSQAKKNKPEKQWIDNIIRFCRDGDVPIFLKNSLIEIMGEPLIQEYPWGLNERNT